MLGHLMNKAIYQVANLFAHLPFFPSSLKGEFEEYGTREYWDKFRKRSLLIWPFFWVLLLCGIITILSFRLPLFLFLGFAPYVIIFVLLGKIEKGLKKENFYIVNSTDALESLVIGIGISGVLCFIMAGMLSETGYY